MKTNPPAWPANAVVRRSAIALVAIALVAVALGATTWALKHKSSSAGAAEAEVDPSTLVLATGTVLGQGEPRAGVTVALLANPTGGALADAGEAGLEMLPIAETSTADDGSYRIWGTLDDLAADYRGRDGQVDLELVFDDGGSGTAWDYTLFPAGTTEPGVTVAVAEEDVARVAPDGGIGENTLAPVLALDLGTMTAWPPGQPSVQVAETETAPLAAYVSDYLDSKRPTDDNQLP
jgi:hypothetical protein